MSTGLSLTRGAVSCAFLAGGPWYIEAERADGAYVGFSVESKSLQVRFPFKC